MTHLPKNQITKWEAASTSVLSASLLPLFRPHITGNPGKSRGFFVFPEPAKFFKESPLYKKFEIDGLPERAASTSDKNLYEPLNMDCGSCDIRQSFGIGYPEIDGWWINFRQDAHEA
jgi:hypothetical protein